MTGSGRAGSRDDRPISTKLAADQPCALSTTKSTPQGALAAPARRPPCPGSLSCRRHGGSPAHPASLICFYTFVQGAGLWNRTPNPVAQLPSSRHLYSYARPKAQGFPALAFTLATPATPGMSTPPSLHLPRRCAARGYLGAATSHLARRVCVRCAAWRWRIERREPHSWSAAPRQPRSVSGLV